VTGSDIAEVYDPQGTLKEADVKKLRKAGIKVASQPGVNVLAEVEQAEKEAEKLLYTDKSLTSEQRNALFYAERQRLERVRTEVLREFQKTLA
jgi:hypothetical protein